MNATSPAFLNHTHAPKSWQPVVSLSASSGQVPWDEGSTQATEMHQTILLDPAIVNSNPARQWQGWFLPPRRLSVLIKPEAPKLQLVNESLYVSDPIKSFDSGNKYDTSPGQWAINAVAKPSVPSTDEPQQ